MSDLPSDPNPFNQPPSPSPTDASPEARSSAYAWGYHCGKNHALREATFYAQARSRLTSYDEYTRANQGFKDARAGRPLT